MAPQPPLQMPLRPEKGLMCQVSPAPPPTPLSSRDIILESIPTDNPQAHSNLYILTGHQSTY